MNDTNIYLQDSWRFLKANLFSISFIILGITLPIDILFLITEAPESAEEVSSAYYFIMVLSFVTYPIYQGALILFISSVIEGDKTHSVLQLYKLALKYWLPLFTLYLIVFTAILTGLLLFILPGLIVMSRCAFSEFICILNQAEPMKSFSDSWKMTEERQWSILAGYAFIFIGIFIPIYTIGYFFHIMNIWNPLIEITLNSIAMVLLSLITIFAFRVYTESDSYNS